jgi:hypothetical protein
MLALNGLAWLAIGEGVVIVLLLAVIACLLIVFGRYEPHFDITPFLPHQDVGQND